MLLLKCYLPKYPAKPADDCFDRLLNTFGGVTSMPLGVGTWRDPALGEVTQEPVRVLECYIPDDDLTGHVVWNIMQQYKEEARQVEVLYSLTEVIVIKL